MIKTNNKVVAVLATAAVAIVLFASGCNKDTPATPARTTTYTLKVKDQLGVSGTVKFTETSSTVTTVEIALTGGDVQYHPAHIHMNAAVEGGGIAITLSPVIGGKSTTVVTALDNSTTVNYSQLIAYDGYVNVHESNVDMTQIIAQGDIGGNALSGTSKTYALTTVGTLGVSGTALFEKRINGKTLVSIALVGTIAGDMYPADIRLGSVTTVGGGPTVKTLNMVDGTTGKSYSNIRTLDDATVVSYDDLLVYDGYLAIHESAILMANILCQGNIGTH